MLAWGGGRWWGARHLTFTGRYGNDALPSPLSPWPDVGRSLVGIAPRTWRRVPHYPERQRQIQSFNYRQNFQDGLQRPRPPLFSSPPVTYVECGGRECAGDHGARGKRITLRLPRLRATGPGGCLVTANPRRRHELRFVITWRRARHFRKGTDRTRGGGFGAACTDWEGPTASCISRLQTPSTEIREHQCVPACCDAWVFKRRERNHMNKLYCIVLYSLLALHI